MGSEPAETLCTGCEEGTESTPAVRSLQTRVNWERQPKGSEELRQGHQAPPRTNDRSSHLETLSSQLVGLCICDRNGVPSAVMAPKASPGPRAPSARAAFPPSHRPLVQISTARSALNLPPFSPVLSAVSAGRAPWWRRSHTSELDLSFPQFKGLLYLHFHTE